MTETAATHSGSPRTMSRVALTLWTGADKALPMLYGVAVVFIPLRLFSGTEWAVWSLFNMIFMILSLLGDFFILQPMVKLCSEHASDRKSIITASVVLYALFTLGTALIVVVASTGLAGVLKTPEAVPVFNALVWVMCTTILRNIVIRVLQIDYRIIAIFLVDLSYFAVVIAMMLYGMASGTFTHAMDLVHYNLYSLGASSLLGLLMCPQIIVPTFLGFRRSARDILDLGVHQGGTGILTVLQQQGDVAIVSGIRGSAAVGVYNAARMFYQSFTALREGAQLLLVPTTSRAYSQERIEAVQEITELSTAALVVICVPLTAAVILLAPWIVNIIMPKYPEAIDEFQWLIANGFLLPFVIVPSAVLLGIGQARSLFRGTFIGTVVLIFSGLVLTWFFGSVGMAIGVFAGTSVTAIILTGRMNEYVHFTFRSVLRRSRSFIPAMRERIAAMRSPKG